jgi:hypothetical protein
MLPELLDQLPSASPVALYSRRDLRIINRLLGSTAVKDAVGIAHSFGKAFRRLRTRFGF